ncbi:hypothetical protein Pcinc_007239, partial [Petrolisthes cinctipes]
SLHDSHLFITHTLQFPKQINPSPTITTMKILLLLLLSCLAALALASPLPQPQERNPRTFYIQGLDQVLENVLGNLQEFFDVLRNTEGINEVEGEGGDTGAHG